MDIVKQLRDAWKTSFQNSLLISQAADEIERLRKERDELLEVIAAYERFSSGEAIASVKGAE